MKDVRKEIEDYLDKVYKDYGWHVQSQLNHFKIQLYEGSYVTIQRKNMLYKPSFLLKVNNRKNQYITIPADSKNLNSIFTNKSKVFIRLD